MIRLFRKIYRLVRVVGILIYWGFPLVRNYRTKDKWEALKNLLPLISLWAKDLLNCLNIHVTIHGDPAKYDGGLVVSNHMGYTDILVHSSVYGMRFCPNSGIKKWPLLGWYVGKSIPIWIDRSSRLKSKENLEEFRATLEHKIPLIIYPEGTSTDGTSLLPFKPSPFEVAASGGFSIQPLVTFYHVDKGEFNPCWYTDISMSEHLWNLLGINRIDCDVYILDPIRAEGRDRKALAEHTRDIIVKFHEKYRKELQEKTEKSKC